MQGRPPGQAPRQGQGQPRPLTQAELARRRKIIAARRKRRRRNRMILLVICLMLLAMLVGVTVFIAGSIRAGLGAHGDTTDTPPGTVEDVGMQLPSIPPETTAAETEALAVLTTYSAPHMITADPLVLYEDEGTVTLDEELACRYALIAHAETGHIKAWKNASEIIYPASMTKLMTVLVAYETIIDHTQTFRMTNEIIDPLYLDGLSLAGFVGGEDVMIRDLMYGSALPSGAEASVALAIAACGTEEAFVKKMNERAASLGMQDTHFENCTGAHHDAHVSTLSDIATLMAHVMKNEELYEIFSTYQHTTAPTPDHPQGLLLTSTVFSRMRGDESMVCTVIGGKTGYTVQAQQCLATYGVHSDTGEPFVCVTAYGDTKWRPVYDSIYLYQYHTQ